MQTGKPARELKKMPTAKIETFDANVVLSHGLARGKTFEILAELFDDGASYVINPTPCSGGPLFRLPKQAITILGDEIIYFCEAADNKRVRRIRISSDAECFKFEHGTASGLLMPNASLSVLERTTDTLRASISLKADGSGTLAYGSKSVQCRGKKKYNYLTDVINNGFEGVDKFTRRWSDEFDVWMPWAVLIDGNRGVFIHQFPLDVESAGCIHLSELDARDFYGWVTGKTRITIALPW